MKAYKLARRDAAYLSTTAPGQRALRLVDRQRAALSDAIVLLDRIWLAGGRDELLANEAAELSSKLGKFTGVR